MDSTDTIYNMLQLKVWAVVGATDNPEKFGCKIFKLMDKAGYKVYPVNPGVSCVMGAQCYPTLADLPVKPDAVDFVVPSKVGEEIVKQCVELGIKNVWLQPGANGENVIAAARAADLNLISNSCIMVEIRKRDPYL